MGVMDFPWWVLGLFIFFVGLSVFWYWSFLVGLLCIIGGIMLIGIWFVARPKYPVDCIIFMNRQGSAAKIFRDKASRFKHSEGSYYYKFKKLKDETKPAQYKNIYPSSKGGDIAFFMSPAAGQYLSMTIEEVKDKLGGMFAELKLVPDDLHEWLVLKTERNKQKFKFMSAFEKYYPIIIVIILAVVLVIVISGIFQTLTPFIEALTNAANTNSAAMVKMADAMEMFAKTVGLNETTAGNNTLPLPPPPPDVAQ